MPLNGNKSPDTDATITELRKILAAQTLIIQALVEQSSHRIDQREAELKDAYAKLQEAERQRENALKDVVNIENSFAELHGRYEKLKGALESSKSGEDKLRDRLEQTEAIDSVQQDREALQAERDKDLTSLRVQLKRAEMKIKGLESQLEQKTSQNVELANMLDEFTAQ